MKIVDKPWGYEEIWAEAEKYVGKYLHINAPHRLSLQYHDVKDETIRIVEGVMDLEFEDGQGVLKTVRLTKGDVFHIPPKMKHRMRAIENCVVLEISTPELGDIIRLSDDYNRVA